MADLSKAAAFLPQLTTKVGVHGGILTMFWLGRPLADTRIYTDDGRSTLAPHGIPARVQFNRKGVADRNSMGESG